MEMRILLLLVGMVVVFFLGSSILEPPNFSFLQKKQQSTIVFQPRGERRLFFIYLVTVRDQAQGRRWVTLANATRTDVVILCWKDENCGDPELNKNGSVNWVYRPGQSWTFSRNVLLSLALEKERIENKEYQYLIFADADAELILDETVKQKYENNVTSFAGNVSEQLFPYRYFEYMMHEYQPPFGCTSKRPWNCYNNEADIVPIRYCDADFNAFHRKAVPILLPYATTFDSKNWYASRCVLLYRMLCVDGYPLQVNGYSPVPEEKEEHAPYPKKGDAWQIARSIVDEYLPPLIASEVKNKNVSLQEVKCMYSKAEKRANWTSAIPDSCRTQTMRNVEHGGFTFWWKYFHVQQ
jgi:hypothetical protein